MVTVPVSSFQHIDEAVVLRDDQMARSRALLQLQDRWRVRGEASALFVEQELENLVGAEMRDEDETVRVVDADRVRIARGWHNLQRLADPAVRADWVHAYEIGSVGRPEKKSTATVERDVGKAFR